MNDLIITGRIFNKNVLIGYRAWQISKNKDLRVIHFYKEDIPLILSKYNILNCEFVKKTNSFVSKIRISISDYPRYTEKGKLSYRHRFIDSSIIAITLNKPVESVRIKVCGALISGAIYDTFSDEAMAHAELYYEEIRHMSTDVSRIAKRTGYSEEDIARVKNYLFMNQHNLVSGYKRFDACIEIAHSWQRLLTDNMPIEKHDLTLLKHEFYEENLVKNGIPQLKAHEMASEKYNYPKESREYYDKVRKNCEKR